MALSHILKTWDSTTNHIGVSPIIQIEVGHLGCFFVGKTNKHRPRQDNSNRETWGCFTLPCRGYNLITQVVTGFGGPNLAPLGFRALVLPSANVVAARIVGSPGRTKHPKDSVLGRVGQKDPKPLRIDEFTWIYSRTTDGKTGTCLFFLNGRFFTQKTSTGFKGGTGGNSSIHWQGHERGGEINWTRVIQAVTFWFPSWRSPTAL